MLLHIFRHIYPDHSLFLIKHELSQGSGKLGFSNDYAMVMTRDRARDLGVSKISDASDSNVTQFPMPVYTPGGQGGDSGN